MNEQVAYEAILPRIEEIEALKKEKDEGSLEYQRWMERTQSLIREIFGNKSDEYSEIHKLFHPQIVCSPFLYSSQTIDYHKRYLVLLDNAKNKLLGFTEILKIRLRIQSNDVEVSAIDSVVNICKRFNNVVRIIRKRHAKRPPLTINDEYDVQYLLKILLAIQFKDIRAEETTPNFACSSSRIDFLLKKEQIAIETKMTRDNLSDKELGQQLILDISYYQSHPDVRNLVCFIFDPENKVTNPYELISDLESRSNDSLKIRVIITPMY